MRCFFDTSALLARYFQRQNSAEVERFFSKATVVLVSSITKAEIYGAFGALLRAGALNQTDHATRLSEAEDDFEDIEIIPYSAAVESILKKIAVRYGHRTLDNIQLASALAARPALFVTADKKLAKLARAEKLRVRLV